MAGRFSLLGALLCGPVFAQAPSAESAPAPSAAPAPATTPALEDHEGPFVMDLSIAADNPDAAPVVTAMLKDNVGVAAALVHWQVAGQPWQETVLVGGKGPLRIARLPDGPQRTGFSLWIEAKDAAGNITRVASEHSPLEVKAAVEGNSERIAHQDVIEPVKGGSDPVWIMVALGAGVVSTATASVAAYDLGLNFKKSDEVLVLLDDDTISAKRRRELERTQTELGQVELQDGAVAITLGAVGAAAVVTGVTLLILAAAEQ